MRKGTMAGFWLRQIAVAALYGASVTLLRHLSISHWLVLCGLHVAALLLVPYRYWPALLVGESASLAYLSVTCAEQFGLAWAICNLVPSVVFVMPVAYFSRERWQIFPTKTSVNINALLVCALLVAALMTGNSLALLAITRLPEGYGPINYAAVAGRWMLGNYMGILTIVPFVLVVRQVLLDAPLRELGTRFWESRLARECTFLLLPTLAFLVWMGLSSSPATNTRQFAQVAMFLPVVWLALRYGWQGAAVGGTLASLAVITLMPARYDPHTLDAQVFIAFAISTMLLMGARIGALDDRAQRERTDLRMALALAQRNVHLGEVQMRMTSQALEQVRESVHSVYNMMLGRLKHMAPVFDDRSYRRQALVAQDQLYRLADSLCPVTWRERGLQAVLREGPIARVLEETGVTYWCDITGSVDLLSPMVHLAIYRLICEAIADGCTRRDVSDIRVQIRCGERRGRKWGVVRISLRADSVRLADVRWDELLPRVLRTATGLGWPAIEDRAATFEGKAREHLLSNGRRISVILFDPESPDGDEHRQD
ncbi:MASE1 domain-containing sensor histidine kinase [Dyella soli]|uniref:MASE1 domain-containing protein n=1 Tax=Dyella soli TaxID=522319 RepID=A0A4R0YX48_9GAMM|nr:MASE1 domain-containing protein [Dyella soli]TCI10064.1 hypothetical protein EZM97_14120 [Dyella soli]